MKNWKAIGLVPLLMISACNSDDNQPEGGYGYGNSDVGGGDYPSAPVVRRDLPSPAPVVSTTAPALTTPTPFRVVVSTPTPEPTPEDCSAGVRPLSDRSYLISSFSPPLGYTYHVTDVKIAQTKIAGNSKSQIRFHLYNPSLRSISYAKPTVECIKLENILTEMNGNFDFPLDGNTTPGASANIVNHTWQLQYGSLIENKLHATTLNPPASISSLESYLTMLTNSGMDFKIYTDDYLHFQIFVTSLEYKDGARVATKSSVNYEYVLVPTGNPEPVAATTPTPTPAPTQVLSGPNRCSVEYPFITIDGKAAFRDTTDRLSGELISLTSSGFCNSTSTLGAEYPFITVNGKSAFRILDADQGVQALIALYNAKVGTPETARCGVEYPFITLDQHSSFRFTDAKVGVQKLIDLIANNACRH